MSKLAVIETGGKQYLVAEGQKLRVEKLKPSKDGGFIFDKVLLVAEGDKATFGTPYVKTASVEGKLLKEGRTRKVVVFKYKPKKRYRVKNTHRQDYTEVEIIKIKP